jgi:hypothetical protein
LSVWARGEEINHQHEVENSRKYILFGERKLNSGGQHRGRQDSLGQEVISPNGDFSISVKIIDEQFLDDSFHAVQETNYAAIVIYFFDVGGVSDNLDFSY